MTWVNHATKICKTIEFALGVRIILCMFMRQKSCLEKIYQFFETLKENR